MLNKHSCLLWRLSPYNNGVIVLGNIQFSSVQSLSHVRLFVTPWITARQAALSITNSQSSLRHIHRLSDAIQPSHPRSSPSSPAPNLPSIRVFSNESTLRMRWPKYWSFSFSIIPSKEIPGLNSFRMDWLDRLAVQGTLKSLLQHFSSKASILRRSAFFTVQLSTVLLRLKEESISRRDSVWPNYERVWKPGTKVSYFGGNGT